MADTNNHTGARLVTKPPTKDYEKGYDLIFGKNKMIVEMQDDAKLSAKVSEHLFEIQKQNKGKT